MTTPAGWYPDPYDASQLRYWDGSVWTDSVTPNASVGGAGAGAPQGIGQVGGTPAFGAQGYSAPAYGAQGGYDTPGYSSSSVGGGYGDVGDWLSSIFTRLFDRIGPMFLLLYAIPVIGVVIAAMLGRNILNDLTITESTFNSSGTVEGFNSGTAGLAGLVLLLTIFAYVVCWLAANHQMYAAHAGQPASIGSSLATAVRRIPRCIGWGLVMMIGVLLIYAAVFAAFFLLVAALVGSDSVGPEILLLIFPVGFILFLLFIWLGVKLAFWGVALAVGPSGTNPFSASWRVSKGRWWGTFGRLILLYIMIWIVSFAFNIVFQVLFGTVTTSMFDSADSQGSVVEFSEIIPGAGWFIVFALLYALNQAITQSLAISGATGLYLRGGGPGEV